MLKVSVIIPCYNHGRYIDEAVDSILGQTFQDFEILVVNDGSTEQSTVEKLQQYNKPKTRVIHTSNQGLAAARNNGIREAIGEYILPLDADDYFDASFLEKAVPVLDGNASVGAVSCGTNYFGQFSRKVMPPGGDVKNFLAKTGALASALYRKYCWEQVGGYNESMKHGYEDWDFWIHVTKRGWKVHVIQEFLFYYRQHAASMRLEAHEIRPILVKQLVQRHKELYAEYVDEIIFEKEQKILTLTKAKNVLRNSQSYKLGNVLLLPLRWIKKLFTG